MYPTRLGTQVDLPATYPEDLVELVWARLAKQVSCE